MYWTSRLTLVTLAALIGACRDDGPTATSPGSSTSDFDPSSSGPNSSPQNPSGTATTSSGSTTDDPTGDVTFGHARFIVSEPIAGTPRSDLALYTYAQGVLSEGMAVVPGLADGDGVGAVYASRWGTALAYCLFAPNIEGSACFITDVATDPPGEPQPLVVDPLPQPAAITDQRWIEDSQTLVFLATATADETDHALYAASLTAGVLEGPQMIASPLMGSALTGDFSTSADGAWLAYSSVTGPGARNAFVVPLEQPDPGAAVMISDAVDATRRTRGVSFLPGRDAAIYGVDYGGQVYVTVEELLFVDFSGPVPSEPVRVDDPLDNASIIRGPRIAPDGHALVYWVGEETLGTLMFVDLSGPVPQPPVAVSLGSNESQIDPVVWSPDSRWIAYRAEHEQPGTFAAYLIDAAGASPGTPFNATGGLIPDGNVMSERFDPSSSWFYYIAQQDAVNPEMFRVELSGVEPGSPQKVSGPLTADNALLTGDLVPSQDWGALLYTAGDGDPRVFELYHVDVSGPQPGAAVRVNAPLAAGVHVRNGARFSADGSSVVYGETSEEFGGPTPMRLVDLDSGAVLEVSPDAKSIRPLAD